MTDEEKRILEEGLKPFTLGLHELAEAFDRILAKDPAVEVWRSDVQVELTEDAIARDQREAERIDAMRLGDLDRKTGCSE